MIIEIVLASCLVCISYLFYRLKFQNVQLRNENNKLQESLIRIKLQNNELQQINREINEIGNRNQNLENRNCAILNENINNRTKIERLEKENQSLGESLRRAKLINANNPHKCISNSIPNCSLGQDLRSKIYNLENRRVESIRIMAENNEKIRSLQENIDRLTNEKTRDRSDLSDKNRTLQGSIDRLTNENIRERAVFNEQTRSLRESIDRITNENNNLKLEIERLKANIISQMDTHIVSLKECFQSTMSSRNNCNCNHTCPLNPAHRIEQWSLANETIKKRNNILANRSQTLQNQINQMRNLNNENTNLTKELNRLSNDLDVLNNTFIGLDIPPNMPTNLNSM